MSNDGDDRETIRFFKFSGEDEDWNEWKKKTLALAEKKGYESAFENDYTGSTVPEEVKQNAEAYNLLMMSCKSTAFGLVEREKGNAKTAWDCLVKLYEVSNDMDLLKLDQEFTACKMADATSHPVDWHFP